MWCFRIVKPFKEIQNENDGCGVDEKTNGKKGINSSTCVLDVTVRPRVARGTLTMIRIVSILTRAVNAWIRRTLIDVSSTKKTRFSAWAVTYWA